jgi:hypothetical protein
MSSDLQHSMDPVKVDPDTEPVSSVADRPTAVSLPVKCAVMVSYAVYPQTLKMVSVLILAATCHMNISSHSLIALHCIIPRW